MAVSNAFLQGDLFEEVYMCIPQGFMNSSASTSGFAFFHGCKLLKSLYGLKHASQQWNIKFTQAFIKHGYVQSKLDYSLFTKSRGTQQVILLVYVDDLLITGTYLEIINELKVILHSCFKLKDLGSVRYFLGLELARSSEGILINQRKYVMELIILTGLGAAKPVATPKEKNQKLTSQDYDQAIDLNINDTPLTMLNSMEEWWGNFCI